jgi:hypothetical protein
MSAWPYISSLATALVAVVATIVGRKSSKDALQSELKQRMWEKRTTLVVSPEVAEPYDWLPGRSSLPLHEQSNS